MSTQLVAKIDAMGGAARSALNQCPELFAALSDARNSELASLTRTQFCSWQFERLLNSAADLLERADENRQALYETFVADLLQRQSLAQSELAARHNESRDALAADGSSYSGLDHYRVGKFLEVAGDPNRQIISHGIFGALSRQVGFLKDLTLTSDAKQRLENSAAKSGVEAALLDFQAEQDTARAEASRLFEELERNREATRLARAQHNERAKAAGEAGVLDYGHRANILAAQMLRDFFEALARFRAAEIGLKDILAFDPESAAKLASQRPVLDQIPELLLVVRERIHWHSLRTQFDQGFTVSVSLRKQCTDLQWKAFWSGSPILFELKASLFSPWSFYRLRGLSASYTGQERRTLALSAKLPEVSLRSDGIEFDQSRIPSCVLGRIWNREASREPEINGAVTLMNGCPLGPVGFGWQVALASGYQEASMEVDDIELELNCMGIPRKLVNQ